MKNINEHSQIDLGVYDIANQAFDAMQSTIARQKLAAYPPGLLAVGKSLISMFISNNQVVDLYDAAIIFLFGATFTFHGARTKQSTPWNG